MFVKENSIIECFWTDDNTVSWATGDTIKICKREEFSKYLYVESSSAQKQLIPLFIYVILYFFTYVYDDDKMMFIEYI